MSFVYYEHSLGAHLGEGSRGPGFRRNALKNQFKNRKNPSERCTNSILLKFSNTALRRMLKCRTKECGINFRETTFNFQT